MTLDEAIKNMEIFAEANQRVVDTGIVFDDVTIGMLYCDDTEVIEEHLANYRRSAEEHRQLAAWLKDYKRLLEQEPCETIKEIPKDYKYDTETEDFLVYRHMYTGHEIHIEKPVPRYRLEQEPCGDAISRKAVEEITWEEPSYTDALNVLAEVREKIRQLPSVTPESKTGHWIEDENEMKVWCSECGDDNDNCSKFCPNCGAKMIEQQGSEGA